MNSVLRRLISVRQYLLRWPLLDRELFGDIACGEPACRRLHEFVLTLSLLPLLTRLQPLLLILAGLGGRLLEMDDDVNAAAAFDEG